MKKIFVICLLFYICCYSIAQTKYETREEKLQLLKAREDIKVTEVEPNILKLEYPNGKVLYKNIGDYEPPTTNNLLPIEYSPTYDSTIIDIATLDTMLYYEKYQYWQEVPLGNFRTLLVGDINNNKLPELYGQMKKYNTDYSDIVVFEMNHQNGFDSVYKFDSTLIAESIYDVDKDLNLEMRFKRNYQDTIHNNGWGQYKFVRKSSYNSLCDSFYFIFEPNYYPSQQNDFYFGNWDGDNSTDQILIRLNFPPSVNIYEYNPNNPNFDSVFQFNYYSSDLYYGGFSIGDFDKDSKTEFLAGSVHGKVLSIENCRNNCYTPIWQGTVQTNNAYLCAETDDLDGNGKKEIWIGGDAYYGGVGKTRITIFEAASNNSYQAVGKIDIIGIFSWDAGNIQVIDLDKDGKEEVLLGLDQTVLILKFNGSMNHQKYEVFYYRRNELALSGRNSIYYGATLYDLNSDEKEDLIINMDEVIQNVGLRLFSYIYKANYTVDIKDEESQLPLVLELHPSYPNPFNSTTKISYSLLKGELVTIKVYDVLGNEVAVLVNDIKPEGNYEVEFIARNLPSGVYFYKMQSGNFTAIKKMLLIR
jgi:hypothetical protein